MKGRSEQWREELLTIDAVLNRVGVPLTGNGREATIAERVAVLAAAFRDMTPAEASLLIKGARDDAGRPEMPPPAIEALPRPPLQAAAVSLHPKHCHCGEGADGQVQLALIFTGNVHDTSSLALLLELLDTVRAAAFDPLAKLPALRSALERRVVLDMGHRKEAN